MLGIILCNIGTSSADDLRMVTLMSGTGGKQTFDLELLPCKASAWRVEAGWFELLAPQLCRRCGRCVFANPGRLATGWSIDQGRSAWHQRRSHAVAVARSRIGRDRRQRITLFDRLPQRGRRTAGQGADQARSTI